MQRLLILPRYGRTDIPYLVDLLQLGSECPAEGRSVEVQGVDDQAVMLFLSENSTNSCLLAIMRKEAQKGFAEALEIGFDPHYSSTQEVFFLINGGLLKPMLKELRSAGVNLGSIINKEAYASCSTR